MTNRVNHFPLGDARRARAPQPDYGGHTLYELIPAADCGCRGTWQLGEYLDGGTLRFGWWTSVSHSQACKKATA